MTFTKIAMIKIRVTSLADLDHVVVGSADELRRVWWMVVANLILFQWFFFRVAAEYTQTHHEMPVRFTGYRFKFAWPGTGWI